MKHGSYVLLEQGDVFFFYRPRVGLDDEDEGQQLYLVLAPKSRGPLRLLVIGHKLPHPEERIWALVAMSTVHAEELQRELGEKTYERHLSAARLLGEGRYQLLRNGDHTELAYMLELPEQPGPQQQQFEIKKEARCVIAVRNPSISAPGFPSVPEPPRYPQHLADKFGDRSWISVDDPQLLDFQNAQLLLTGASELGIHIDHERENAEGDEMLRLLHWRGEIPLEPPFRNEFPR